MIIDIISRNFEEMLKLNLSNAYPQFNELSCMEDVCSQIEKDYNKLFHDYLYLPLQADTFVVPHNIQMNDNDTLNKLKNHLEHNMFYMIYKMPIISDELVAFKVIKLSDFEYQCVLKVVKFLKLKAFI